MSTCQTCIEFTGNEIVSETTGFFFLLWDHLIRSFLPASASPRLPHLIPGFAFHSVLHILRSSKMPTEPGGKRNALRQNGWNKHSRQYDKRVNKWARLEEYLALNASFFVWKRASHNNKTSIYVAVKIRVPSIGCSVGCFCVALAVAHMLWIL